MASNKSRNLRIGVRALALDSERMTQERGRTVHGEAANAGHRVLAPDDAEVEAYLEQALNAAPAALSLIHI